jgi:chromosome transmission fidelity protein 1
LLADFAANEALRDRVRVRSLDLEEAHAAGTGLGACPYFASRDAVNLATIVALPYASLLHGPTRAALGLNLRGAVVVVDEAHNLIDDVLSANNASLSLATTRAALQQLDAYWATYSARLSPLNRERCQTLLATLRGLCSRVVPAGHSVMRSVGEFVTTTRGLDAVSLWDLETYLEESGLCRILRGFAERSKKTQVRQGVGQRVELRIGASQSVVSPHVQKSVRNFLESVRNFLESVLSFPWFHVQAFPRVRRTRMRPLLLTQHRL